MLLLFLLLLFIAVAMVVSVLPFFLSLLFLLWFYVVLFWSQLKARITKNHKKGGGAKSGTTSSRNQRGNYVCNSWNYRVSVFCFFVFVGVFLWKHYKIGFSTTFGHFLVFGSKSRVKKWPTIGSISGPHLLRIFGGRCGPLINPRLLFSIFVFVMFFCCKNLILPAERRI